MLHDISLATMLESASISISEWNDKYFSSL